MFSLIALITDLLITNSLITLSVVNHSPIHRGLLR